MDNTTLGIILSFGVVAIFGFVGGYLELKKKFARYEVGSWVGTTDGVLHWVNKQELRFWTKSNALRSVEAHARGGNLSKEVRDMRDWRYDQEHNRQVALAIEAARLRGVNEGIEIAKEGVVIETTRSYSAKNDFAYTDYTIMRHYPQEKI